MILEHSGRLSFDISRLNNRPSNEFKIIGAIALFCLLLGIGLFAFTAITGSELMVAIEMTIYSSFLNMLIIGGAIFALVRVDPEKLKLGADWPVRIFAAALIVSFKIPFFGIFKQFPMKDRGFPLDEGLASFERSLFGGRDAWEYTHQYLGSLQATMVIDWLYVVWAIPVVISPMLWMAFVKNWTVRVRLLFCWVMIWAAIGGILAWLLGSAGPIFYTDLIGPDAGFEKFNTSFGALEQAAKAANYEMYVTNNRLRLITHYMGGGYAPANGISAMPSVHVAMAVLFAIGGFQLHRIIGWFFAVYAAIIWVGSVHLGWHYASDGAISIILTIALWKGSKYIIPPAIRRRAAPAV